MPKLDPARLGLTNTGSPSRPRSAPDSDWPARSTVYGPTGMPSSSASFLVNSLSMPAAEANTPAPTYGTPAISSSPWTVPSSPYAPCRTGNTTSTSDRTATPRDASTSRPVGPGVSTISAPDTAVISGSRPPRMDSERTSPSVSTQRPSRVIPTGTTSYSSGSSAARMLPALTQEIACSVLRPPKTTATRVFRGVLTRATLPCVSKLLHDHAVVVLHTIGARPASASALSTALNGRLPRNPRGFIGLG